MAKAPLVRVDDGVTLAMLHPRYWLTWLACLLAVLLAWLPWPVQRRLGAGLGRLGWKLVPQRVNDTRINLRLCFPELDDDTREAMARDVFRQGGIGLFETLNAWFGPASRYDRRIEADGIEHLQAAIAQGRGVILLGAHYSHLDLNGLAIARHIPLQVIYRPQNNPVFDWLIRRGRRRHFTGQIDHADMRSLFKALRAGEVVWTSVDQDFGLKQGIMAPFFGHPAATLTATSRMARINNSPVLFLHFMRNTDDDSYRLSVTPMLDDYPSDDDEADATRINATLESLIRRAPSQYMWFHRRFKSQPRGSVAPYPEKKKKPKKRRRKTAA